MSLSDKGVNGMENRQDQEIRYEAMPGYRPLFFLLLTLAAFYLVYIFLTTPPH